MVMSIAWPSESYSSEAARHGPVLYTVLPLTTRAAARHVVTNWLRLQTYYTLTPLTGNHHGTHAEF